MYATLSLDVEEEGLFSGVYTCVNPKVENVSQLWRLEPFLERGIKPTLFCAHSIFADPAARKTIEDFRARPGVEIGCHLHHWNTPPLASLSDGSIPQKTASVPAAKVPPDLMADKLQNLFSIARDFLGDAPTSFRMGRWDMLAWQWRFLEQNGVLCDASVRPLHCGKIGEPDHFAAPADPYWIKTGRLMEIPLTVVPVASVLRKLPAAPVIGSQLAASLKHWGALALLPVQHPLWLLKLTTLIHAANGGKVVSLTWHSSEMAPGATPHLQDEARVTAFLHKMESYFEWLENRFPVTYANMSELRTIFENEALTPCMPTKADWSMAGTEEEKP